MLRADGAWSRTRRRLSKPVSALRLVWLAGRSDSERGEATLSDGVSPVDA